MQIRKVRSIRHQAARIDIGPEREHRRQPVLYRQIREPFSLAGEYGGRQHSESADAPLVISEKALSNSAGPRAQTN